MKAFNIEELRLVAQRRLPRAVFNFIDGGAEDERTLRDNCAAFGRVRLAPKMPVTSLTFKGSVLEVKSMPVAFTRVRPGESLLR